MTGGSNALREITAQWLKNLLKTWPSVKNTLDLSPKTLIQFFQKLNPQISQKELQGKPTEASIKSRVQEYGDLDAKDYIPGTELLKAEEQNTENHPDRWGNTRLSEKEADVNGGVCTTPLMKNS